MSDTDSIIQAQRACVMQPRVRRTLGIESPHTSISVNPNGHGRQVRFRRFEFLGFVGE
jgi:hypothetical protein